MKFLEQANFNWMELLNFGEQPFRAKLIPAKVYKDLDRYRNDALGLSHYVRKWRTHIRWVEQKSKAKLYQTHVAIGGEYDPLDRKIELQIHTDKFNQFHFTDITWNRFKYKVLQVTMHEMIHFMQYDRRGDEWSNYVVPYKKVGKDKVDEERRYLSEFDEIQAYAHCVLLDFKVYRPNMDTEFLLSRANTHKDSPTLNYFLKTFNYDYRNNHAIPKIMQQVVKWDKKYRLINSQ